MMVTWALPLLLPGISVSPRFEPIEIKVPIFLSAKDNFFLTSNATVIGSGYSKGFKHEYYVWRQGALQKFTPLPIRKFHAKWMDISAANSNLDYAGSFLTAADHAIDEKRP